jgi:hypothetical protein
MKRALLKTAFHVAVMVLTLVLLVPTLVVLSEVVWVRLGARGDYHGGIGLLPTIVVLVLLLHISNRVISFLFRASGLSDERWSVFDHRPRRRST